MLRLLIFRAAVSLVVAGAAGGTAALRHPLLMMFVAIEAALSLVEGWHAGVPRFRGSEISRFKDSRNYGTSNQLAFILSGKWYLLSRLIYQIVVLAWFAWLTRTTEIGPSLWNIIGATLMIVGVGLRAWSMATLGERFRGFEVKREERGLEIAGPYRIVRHPGYVALVLIDLGMPLLLSVPYLLALFVLPAAIIVRRIALEDELLATTYPDAYPAYAARTARMVPGLY